MPRAVLLERLAEHHVPAFETLLSDPDNVDLTVWSRLSQDPA